MTADSEAARGGVCWASAEVSATDTAAVRGAGRMISVSVSRRRAGRRSFTSVAATAGCRGCAVGRPAVSASSREPVVAGTAGSSGVAVPTCSSFAGWCSESPSSAPDVGVSGDSSAAAECGPCPGRFVGCPAAGSSSASESATGAASSSVSESSTADWRDRAPDTGPVLPGEEGPAASASLSADLRGRSVAVLLVDGRETAPLRASESSPGEALAIPEPPIIAIATPAAAAAAAAGNQRGASDEGDMAVLTGVRPWVSAFIWLFFLCCGGHILRRLAQRKVLDMRACPKARPAIGIVYAAQGAGSPNGDIDGRI